MQAALCGERPIGSATMNQVSSPLALRPREAARALNISPRTLWQLTKDGHIPCVRVGSGKRKTVLYPLADLQAWLSRESTKAKGGSQ
jgi:excisionase family DNA binding protein